MILYSSDNCIIETYPIGQLQCNMTLIYNPKSKNAIIIDPGHDNPKLLRIIQERELKVLKLLHSHAHFDHIGGSWDLKQMLGTTNFLHKDDLFLYQALALQGKMFGVICETPGPIDEYLLDNQDFQIDDESLEIKIETIHTPGHTPGSVSFYISGNCMPHPVLLSGDTLFAKSIGRTDLPGGNSDLIIQSIKKRLCTLDDSTQVVPGHGLFTTIYQEKKSNPFL